MDKKFRRILREFDELKGQLSQNYLQDDGEPMEDEMYDERGDVMYPGEGESSEADSKEEAVMHANEIIQHEPIIGKIRETAIEGLKKYSDHPMSDIYNFFKKVFLESDKVLTDTGKK